MVMSDTVVKKPKKTQTSKKKVGGGNEVGNKRNRDSPTATQQNKAPKITLSDDKKAWIKKLSFEDTVHDFLGPRVTKMGNKKDTLIKAVSWAIQPYKYSSSATISPNESQLMKAYLNVNNIPCIELHNSYLKANHQYINVGYVDNPASFSLWLSQLVGSKHMRFVHDYNIIGERKFCYTDLTNSDNLNALNVYSLPRAYDKNLKSNLIDEKYDSKCFTREYSIFNSMEEPGFSFFFTIKNIQMKLNDSGVDKESNTLVMDYEYDIGNNKYEKSTVNLHRFGSNGADANLTLFMKGILDSTNKPLAKQIDNMKKACKDINYLYGLDVGKFEDNVKYIAALFDLKKAGDALQIQFCYNMNEANKGKSPNEKYIFVSNDRIPCLYADIIGVPCILTRAVSKQCDGDGGDSLNNTNGHRQRQVMLFNFEDSDESKANEEKSYKNTNEKLRLFTADFIEESIKKTENYMIEVQKLINSESKPLLPAREQRTQTNLEPLTRYNKIKWIAIYIEYTVIRRLLFNILRYKKNYSDGMTLKEKRDNLPSCVEFMAMSDVEVDDINKLIGESFEKRFEDISFKPPYNKDQFQSSDVIESLNYDRKTYANLVGEALRLTYNKKQIYTYIGDVDVIKMKFAHDTFIDLVARYEDEVSNNMKQYTVGGDGFSFNPRNITQLPSYSKVQQQSKIKLRESLKATALQVSEININEHDQELLPTTYDHFCNCLEKCAQLFVNEEDRNFFICFAMAVYKLHFDNPYNL